ncbi:MAG: hypothetical protein AB2A00_01435 [Myxococcota bacterium]
MARALSRRAADWEWPGAAELVAMLVFFLVVASAALGMLLRVIHPRRARKVVAQAVQEAAQQVQAAAEQVQAAAEQVQAAADNALQPSERAGKVGSEVVG